MNTPAIVYDPEILASIREAYGKLTDEQKRRISQCVAKKNQDLFKYWHEAANPKGFTAKGSASRPPGVAIRFDHAISKSDASPYLLRRVTVAFFSAEFTEWIEFVCEQLAGVTTETIVTRLEEVLRQSDAPFRGSEWEALFVARARLTPHVWLEAVQERVSDEGADSDLDEKENLSSAAEPVAELYKQLAELGAAIESASVAKAFDLERARQTLDAVAALGTILRQQLAKLADETKQSVGDWATLDELVAKIAGLEVARSSVCQAVELRRRLGTIIDALKRITRIEIKAASRRAFAEEKRKKAIVELESGAQREEPPVLPLSTEGEAWLRQVLELGPNEFEDLLEKLAAVTLNGLREFLAEVESWDRLVFEATSDEPQPTSQQASPNTGTFDVSLEPPKSAIVASVLEKNEAHSSELTRENAESTNQTPIKEIKEVPVVVAPRKSTPPFERSPSEVPTTRVTPLQPPDSAKADELVSRPLLGQHPDLEDITRHALRHRWAVVGLWIRLLGDPAGLPASRVFFLLSLTRVLRQSTGTVADEIRITLGEMDAPTKGLSEAALLLWCSALLPATIFAPASNAAAFLRACHWSERLGPLRDLVQAAVRLAESVPQCDIQLLRGAQPRAVWENQLKEIAAGAEQFEREAVGQTILYQPATEVWKHLNKHGAVFSELARHLRTPNGKGDRQRVIAIVDQVRPGKTFNKLIQETHVRLASKNTTRIEARAIPQFEGKSRPLLNLATRWLEVTEAVPPASDFVSERIQEFRIRWAALAKSAEACAMALTDLQPKVWGDIARLAVADSFAAITVALDGNQPFAEVEPDASEVLRREWLCVPSLKLNQHGVPVGSSVEQVTALRDSAKSELNGQSAFDIRLSRNDFVGARQLLDIFERDGVPGAPEMRNAFETSEAKSRRDLSHRLRAVRTDAASVRVQGIVGESAFSALDSALVTLEKRIQEDDDLETVRGEIDGHAKLLEDQRRIGQKELLEQIRAEVPLEPERARLQKLVSSGDVITAREYLARLRAGQTLPESDGNHLEPFAGFTLGRQNDLVGALNSSGDLGALRAAINTSGVFLKHEFKRLQPERRQRDSLWIDSWLRAKSSGAVTDDQVENLLSGLGFVVQSAKTTERGALQVSEVKVEVLADRSLCPIPKFGSLAGGSVIVRHIWSRLDEDAIVQAVGETAHQPQLNIVFFYGRIAPDRRLALARLCRSKRRSFLVLDELLFAHLCFVTEGRLGVFFRASTPYSYADPFVTASSLVPPEMFFGRVEELAALLEPANGRCFVYGGRQLGKTALLREAERRFHSPDNKRFAVWIDLLNQGIGRESRPSAIWDILLREFARWPGFERKTKSGSPPETRVPEILQSWLADDPERRVLLLLDEADRFLDEDAKDDFAEARRLKGIMDRTDRHFKVVFAGLHNVQRTTQQANHPLAHLGEPINVGALSQNAEWQQAFALAAEPLTALGARFSSADLVSRILTLCNFYPGLVQQFCSRMWRRLVDRRAEGPPFAITEAELDEVNRDPAFREDIVGRFKLTLQLDPRYWLLAYIVAHRFLEAPKEADHGYTVVELRKMALDWWMDGFSHSSADEFRSLLDEMCQLGVFRSTADRYGFRNANLLLLLGTPDEVVAHLVDGPRKIVDYTPRSFRARKKGREAFLRRPLTLTDESQLCVRKNGVSFVVGSRALGLDAVMPSFVEVIPAARQQTIRASISTPGQFAQDIDSIAAATRRNDEGLHLVWVPASIKWTEEWVSSATELCRKLSSDRRFIRVVFEVGPEALWEWAYKWLRAHVNDGMGQVFLKKWSEDFLRPLMSDISIPMSETEMTQLMDATGGWPEFVHEFARRQSHEGDKRRTFESLKERPPITKEDVVVRLMGSSVAASTALSILRKLQVKPDETLFDADLPAYAELLEVPEETVRDVLSVAEILGLADVIQPGARKWDPVFERLVLRES